MCLSHVWTRKAVKRKSRCPECGVEKEV